MKIIDLSLPMGAGMPVFPGTDPCSVARSHQIPATDFTMGHMVVNSHAGTHCDAPMHFLADGEGIQHWALERCVGEARVLDFSHKKPREEITRADLLPYDEYFTPGAKILLRTDWDLQIDTGDNYFHDYPGVSVDAAQYLVEKKIGMLGCDAASQNDVHGTEVHRTLLSGDILLTESLANLRELPTDKPFFYVGTPWNWKDADGMPVRAIAIIFD